MKTIEIKLYKFEELSKEAQQKAINNKRDEGIDTDFIYDDAYKTVKEFHKVFNTDEGTISWLDVRLNFEDDILNLKGIRLRTYILNNFGYALFTPKFIGSLSTNEFVSHKRIKSPVNVNSVGNRFNPYYSGVQKDNSCVLTGVCYDESLLKPIYDFLEWNEKPDYNSYMDIETLIDECFESLKNDIESEIDYMNEDNYIIDEIENNDTDFTEDGEVF